MSIVLGILTFFLIIVSIFLVLIVLAQKAKSDGGVGAALGGGMTEAAFGADTGNMLSKATIYASVMFFVLTLSLYLGRIYEQKHALAAATNALPTISVPASPVPPAAAVPPAATTAPEAPKNP
ncbi:MAG: preprotein translocase subunit SecG [Opitutia bacterium Tous-C4FEB]|jgi:preprotein translocase subunit SecG|nr:MAG: preprotein translocase subunit SecG [Opitutae bacterium Tous-C5TDCM]PAW90552.1 MAG: preprotein translocase subunit SecG [Opitutae bacterium Tous-C4FEB]